MLISKIFKASLCFFIKGLFFFSAVSFAQQNNYAPYGEVFTPKGDIRFLIICADFKGFGENIDHGEWDAINDHPEFLSNNNKSIFYNDTSDFLTFENDSAIKNLSKLYFEMSNNKTPFRVIADVYPTKITVDPDSVKGYGWGAVNKEVILTMKREDPTFDWSPYDQRTNKPNFKFDNSISQPDGKPDYVVILYRFDNNWDPQPKSGMSRWLNGAEGASTLSMGSVDYNGYTVGSDGFYSFSSTTKNAKSFIGMFKHELGHELFSCPHYMGANEAYGKRFYAPSVGWGATVCSYHLNETINAWERWMLGWIDIKYDIKKPQKNKCTIHDFATSGDAIRIEIPHSNGQHLWIENHQKISVFDHNALRGELINTPKGSSGIPDIEKGIYMFVEDMMGDRGQIKTRFVYDMNAVNGVNILNAQGNFDYSKPTVLTQTTDWSVYWNSKVYHFKRGDKNPFSGVNPYIAYRHDFNNSGNIDFKHNFNGGNGESATMVMEIESDTNFLFYGINGGRNSEALKYRRSPAFQNKDELSMVSNPVIVNYPYYHSKKDSIAKVYFNALKIKFKERKSGVFKVAVRYNNFKLKEDLRVAGNVGIIQDAFILRKRKELLVNKSGTVNRIKGGGDFVNATNFSVSDSGSLILKPKSILSIQKNSDVEIGENSKLKVLKGAGLNLNGTSTLKFHEKSIVTIHKKSAFLLEGESKIIIRRGAVLNGRVVEGEYVFTSLNISHLRELL